MSARRRAAIACVALATALFALLRSDDDEVRAPDPDRGRAAPEETASGEPALSLGTPATIPTPATESSRVSFVTFRDLATGGPARGVRVAVGASVVEADGDGKVALAEDAREWTVSKPWVAASAPDEARETGTCWAYRVVDVRIDVRKSNGDAVDDRATQVTTTAGVDTSSATHVVEPRDPWSMGWLEKHRLREPARLKVSAGSATASLPAIRWTFVRASAPGWESAPVEVEFSPPPAKTSVVVVMHPVATLSGRVVSEDGTPVADALVRVHVLRKGTVGEVSIPFQPTAGMTVGVLPSGVARVTYTWETRTDAEGRYAVEVPERGEVSAYVLAAEHGVGRRVALDPTSAGDFTLRKKAPRSARVSVAGSPVPPGVFVFTDVTDDDRKVPHQTAVSPEGTVDTTWLEEGRQYWLLVAGGRAGDHSSTFLTWDGRTEIELTELETSFDDFWAGVRRPAK